MVQRMVWCSSDINMSERQRMYVRMHIRTCTMYICMYIRAYIMYICMYIRKYVCSLEAKQQTRDTAAATDISIVQDPYSPSERGLTPTPLVSEH